MNILDDFGSVGVAGGVVADLDPVLSDSDPGSSPPGLTHDSEEGFAKFLLKNNGILYENNLMQIGVKSEYKKNLGQCVHA